MIPILIAAALSYGPLSTPRIVFVQLDTLTAAPVTQASLQEAVHFYSGYYDVEESEVNGVISCESGFDQYAWGDNGDSRGLVQIDAKYHPEIKSELRLNPYFSINFLVSEIAAGRGFQWSCYRKLQQKSPR